ncbi:glycosyltransferase family 4 protein [Anaerosacchariphilus polymeriproducens]|uniref:Glycosyltransferase WbuB n=1 Tax=Anaerosacchariphilus polymeriproducens TaxID=1812858 RepID=A0A371AQZ1_9FIRM|nr:glycosyltransferase family 4 protein [Anaerosacchariphilus polymeriproducens]RDU21995.1 glycosyltransferase WbuB [Anaerosacchariphilus polymeriproducens]
MRILYIATSFPEPRKGATIYTDLAEALYKAGHEITVVVSEEKRNRKVTKIKKERGFEVLRVVTGNYYNVGFIEKGITTFKIPLWMRWGISKYLGGRKFDFILFESPPITIAGLVAWAKKKYNCPAYLMLKDIFPQNALDLNILYSNSLLYKVFKRQEKRLYKTADKIGCMSEANITYLHKHNPWLMKDKLEIFPNTKKLREDISRIGFPMRARYGIREGACVFLFGGNMGRPQFIQLLCKAIKECKEEKDIFFLFIGRGTDSYKLDHTIKKNQIENALVINELPRIEYEQIINECDVGLIILDPRFTIPNYPSRILSYMEYAKPVLVASDRVTDLKELVEDADCGEWVWSGDVDSFVLAIKRMADSDDLIEKGMNGRNYIETHFRVEKSVEILEKHFDA